MATGDMTIVVTIEGGSAKTATIPSATRANGMAWLNRTEAAREVAFTDDTYAVHIANGAARGIIHSADKQITAAAKPSEPTFTAAT